jgi:hypothetical protein
LAVFDHELIRAVAANVNVRGSARVDLDFCTLIHIKAARRQRVRAKRGPMADSGRDDSRAITL